MSFSSTSSAASTKTGNPSADAFQGLREQIMGKPHHLHPPTTCNILTVPANAAILFPQIVATSDIYVKTGFAKPSEVFQVIIVANGESKRALLLYCNGLAVRIAARGPPGDGDGDGDEAALAGLLQLTSEALGWYSETLLGELEHGEEVAGGEVNYLLVEEGFHFAAEQRILEKA